jgi:hypothetical protein
MAILEARTSQASARACYAATGGQRRGISDDRPGKAVVTAAGAGMTPPGGLHGRAADSILARSAARRLIERA